MTFKAEHREDFGKIKVGFIKETHQRQINRWKKIVSRFIGKLVKMVKDIGSKFDD